MAQRPLALVVDDDVDFREIVSNALESGGYEVVSAPDGEAGVRAFDERKPDLVLLDGHLPDVDGFEVCRRLRLRPHGPRAAILLCTVRSALSSVGAGVEAGADDYVLKPFDVAELLERAASAVSRAKSR